LDEHVTLTPDQLKDARHQLEIYEAVARAQERRYEVLDAVFDADNADGAVAAVRELLDIGEVPALAVLDLQVRRFTRQDRAHVIERVAELRAILAS
jgi:DNA gyrase subunit A